MLMFTLADAWGYAPHLAVDLIAGKHTITHMMTCGPQARREPLRLKAGA